MARAPTPGTVRVLLVEDSAGDAVLAIRALRAGEMDGDRFEIVTATSLGEAVTAAAEDSFDVVLLDLSLPDSSGLDTLERVREEVEDIPIVVLTGHDDQDVARAAMAAGAQDWLGKNHVDEYVLPRAVRWAIERHRHVRDLRTAIDDRDRANHELARSARLQSEFVAVASHELRTPVTVMAGLVEVLLDRWEDLEPDQVRDLMAPLHRQSTRLVSLVTDLFLVSRLETGQLELTPAQLDLRKVLEAAVAQLDVEDVEVRVPAGLRARGDNGTVRRIVSDLVDNAAKHGGAPITVIAYDRGGSVDIAVEDHGPGVDPDFVAVMFDRFTQAENPRTRHVGGAGLGLSIAAGLATAMRGALRYEPMAPRGARFVLQLPAAVTLPEQTPRVLVVDDQEDVRALAMAALGADDRIELELVATGEDAVDAYRRFRPDVTVMDYLLPGRDGLDAAEAIRAIDPDHPVILWSNYLDDAVRRRAHAAGVVAVMAKGDMPALRAQVLSFPRKP